MAQEDIQPNVVLTADNAQYDTSMQQSVVQTNKLANSVDTLGNKINNLTRSAGKKLLGLTAGDVGIITASTAAYAAYEKQMMSLSTQAAVMSKSMDAQKRTFSEYGDQVNDLRKSFGDTTSSAAMLVQTLSKMGDNTTPVKTLADTFEKLGNTVGEAPAQLATSMLQLQKTMGTSQRDTSKFSNELAVLQASANTSASSILDFTNSIAPIGRLANISQTDLMGLSTGFIKAGQDGYQAANVFTKVMTDITTATQSGSPDLAKYAALVGMTTQHFKELGGSDQILQIFNAINRQGPAAITTLNRLGLDGARTVRAVSAVAQSGGLQAAIDQARGADDGAIDRGSSAAMDTIVDKLGKLRSELTTTAEAFGKTFAPAAGVFIETLSKIISVAGMVVNSPLGKMAGIVLAIAAPFTALAAAVLLASKAIAAFSALRLVTGGALASGFKAGPGATAPAESNVFGRGMFNAGSAASNLRGSGGTLLSRTAGYMGSATGGLARLYGQTLYGSGAVKVPGVSGSGGYSDFNARPRLFGAFGSEGTGGLSGAFYNGGQRLSQMGTAIANTASMGYNSVLAKAGNSGAAAKVAEANVAKQAAQAERAAQALSNVESSAMTATKGLSNLGRGVGNALGMMGAAGVGGLRSAGSLAGGLGKTAYGLVGSNPYVAGGAALFAGYELYKHAEDQSNHDILNTAGFNQDTYAAAGVTGPATTDGSVAMPKTRQTLASAMSISPTDINQATSSNYKLTNSALKGLSADAALARLSTQWSTIASSPNALNATALDLTNQYGAAQAQSMLSQLSAGGSNLDVFGSSAADPGKRGFTGHVFRIDSGDVSGQQLDQLYGGASDLRDQVTASSGMQAGSKAYSSSISSALNSFFKAGGGQKDSLMPDFQREFAQNVLGFSGSTSDEFNDKLDTVFGNDSLKNVSGTKGYIKNLFQGSFDDGQGVLGANQDLAGAALSRYGLDPNDPRYKKTDGSANTYAEFKDLYKAFTTPPKDTSVEDKDSAGNLISRATEKLFGSGGILSIATVKTALGPGSGDTNAQYAAINSVVNKLQSSNMSVGSQLKYLGNLRAASDDNAAEGSDIFTAAQQQIQQSQSYRAPYQSRTQNFSAATDIFANAETTNVGASGLADRKAAAQAYASQVQDQYSYFKNLLYQQREYDISRSRSEQDFATQQQYTLQDFSLSRSRAEADFQLQRQRSEADYGRQMSRSYTDFALSRQRQEQDYNHQVLLMVQQQAQSMYDIYSRVDVKRTDSANYLLVNAQSQLQMMNQQEKNLNQLRKSGVNDNVIQQLGLTSSDNAQQLARFAAEIAEDPSLVKKFNESIKKRLDSATGLVTDSSSSEWKEFERQYDLARSRAQDDFDKSMKRSRQDFNRSLDEQDDDFKRSLSRQQADFDTAQQRQETAFNLSMQRSADDLERSAETIDGSFTDILTQATDKLSGHAQQQANQVLDSFRDMRKKIAPEGVSTMRLIADIFGVKYTPPKSASSSSSDSNPIKGPTANHQQAVNQGEGIGGMAAGGVMPGWSPTVDVHHFSSPTGGELHLSGGEAVMVPEWTKAIGGPGEVARLNKAARNGRMQELAGGGVIDPDTPVDVGNGMKLSRIAVAQLNVARKVFGMNPYIMQGGYGGNHIAASGTSHNYPGVADVGPGSIQSEEYLRKVGFAAWARNIPGRSQVGSGAHVHSVSLLDPGDRSSPQVTGSWPNYGNGLSGYHNDPAPHYPLVPNLQQMLGAVADHLKIGGAAGGRSSVPPWSEVVKKLHYPKSEAAAAAMSGLHVLQPGMITDIINARAKAKFDQLHKQYRQLGQQYAGVTGSTNVPTGNVPGSMPTDTPSGNNPGTTPNQRIVYDAMRRHGWNEWPSMYDLVTSESGFNNTAQNPTSTAYGMFQFLDSTWAGVGGHKTSDPSLQAEYGARYIGQRYGDPNKAWAFHKANNYYGDGAIFNQGMKTIGVGERGPEMVLPLNGRGVDFLVELMGRTQAGTQSKQTHLAGCTPIQHVNSTYNIDRSTTFSGAITVQSTDPNEFISKLKARQRVMALSQPSLAGTR